MAWMPSSPTCTPDYQRYNPFRAPDWRWQRAASLLATGRHLAPRVDDDWVARALRLQAAQQRRGRGAQPQHRDEAVSGALHMARNAAPEKRLRLEAYLLTAVPFEEVAARCAVRSGIAESYHQLFFSVRDRLRATDWIMAQAIGDDLWHGLAAPGVVCKYAAYVGGANLLEVVIAITAGWPLPIWLQESFVGNPSYEEARFLLRARLCLAALAATSVEELALLVEIYQQFRRLDRRATGTQEEDRVLQLMGRFLKMVARRVPTLATPQPAPAEPGRKDRSPVAASTTRRPTARSVPG